MQALLQSKLGDLLLMETMLDNIALSSHVSPAGILTVDSLCKHLQSNLLFKHDDLSPENLALAIKSLPYLALSEDEKSVSCRTWKEIVYSVKVCNLSLSEFFELEEHLNNKGFDMVVKDKEFLSGESAMLINLNINYKTNERVEELVAFIENNPRFATKKVQKNVSNLKDLLFRRYNENKLHEDLTNLHIEPNRKMRLGSCSEDHLTPCSIITFFAEHHDSIKINPNLLKIEDEAKPILNIAGEIRVEQLEPTTPTKEGRQMRVPNHYKHSLQVGRKGSFKKPERKGSYWN